MTGDTTPDTDPAVSRRMAATHSRDTAPELRVRRLLRSMGYGYRLHVRDLPGTPDIVMKKYRRAVIEVRGCFWHLHGCPSCRPPESNVAFWGAKLERNRERDDQNVEKLEALGWRVLVVWECEMGCDRDLMTRLREFLEGRPS
jgi:DNA mismatch endonuclease (patch repair protein)